jgi:DNA-binding MarR family transcriptional regulator
MQASAKGTGAAAAAGAAAAGAAAAEAVDPKLTEDLATFVKYLMHAHGEDFFKAVGELDLSFSQVRILGVLARETERASVNQLAERLGLSLPAVSRSVEGLVKRGYVTRAEDADDRRVKQIAATGDGRALLARLVELRVAGAAEFLSTLSPKERTKLASALEPIVARDEVAAVRQRVR